MTRKQNKMQMPLVIGLMSGTSADGIDGCIVQTDGERLTRTGISLCQPYRSNIVAAIRTARTNPTHLLADPASLKALSNAITDDHHLVIKQLVQSAKQARLPPVELVGFHGQSVYHNPAERRTVQLGDGKRLACACGLSVIYDFRKADIEAGGQGAPLAPVYHRLLIRTAGLSEPAGFLNLGGIANLSVCVQDKILGFDTGPANALMDDVCQRELEQPFDQDGKLAKQGRINQKFVDSVMTDPYFRQIGPRSLDWGHFRACLQKDEFLSLSIPDKLASLAALTAQSLAHAIAGLPFKLKSLIVSGGGTHNQSLMTMIRLTLPQVTIMTAEQTGVSSDMIEAELIAFLAARHMSGLASTWPETTGTLTPQIVGVRASP